MRQRLLFLQDRLAQNALVARRRVQDAVLDHVDERRRLDGDQLAVFFHMDLMPGHHLTGGVDAVLRHERNVLGQDVGGQGRGRIGQVHQPAALGLRHPGAVIAVAAEDDAAVALEDLAQKDIERLLEIRRARQAVGEAAELLGHDRVEDRIGARDRLARAGHAELEFIAGESQRRGAVAVGRILRDGGQHVDADAQLTAGLFGVVLLGDDGVDDILQLGAEEDGDHGRGRLLRAETVVVAREGDGAAQQLLIFIHARDEGRQEQQKLRVLAGRLAGGEEVFARVGAQRPVIVLAGAVDTRKGLFMQQADQPVPVGDLLHDLHCQLVLVVGGVAVAVDGGHLVLGRSDLVVLGLAQNAELP